MISPSKSGIAELLSRNKTNHHLPTNSRTGKGSTAFSKSLKNVRVIF